MMIRNNNAAKYHSEIGDDASDRLARRSRMGARDRALNQS